MLYHLEAQIGPVRIELRVALVLVVYADGGGFDLDKAAPLANHAHAFDQFVALDLPVVPVRGVLVDQSPAEEEPVLQHPPLLVHPIENVLDGQHGLAIGIRPLKIDQVDFYFDSIDCGETDQVLGDFAQQIRFAVVLGALLDQFECGDIPDILSCFQHPLAAAGGRIIGGVHAGQGSQVAFGLGYFEGLAVLAQEAVDHLAGLVKALVFGLRTGHPVEDQRYTQAQAQAPGQPHPSLFAQLHRRLSSVSGCRSATGDCLSGPRHQSTSGDAFGHLHRRHDDRGDTAPRPGPMAGEIKIF